MNFSNNQGNAAVIVIVIFLAGIVMFIFPLKTIADKKDETVMLEAQKIITEQVNKWRTKGVITSEDIDNLTLSLNATGAAFDVELKVLVLDTNPTKKSTGATITIGNNVYYVDYTTQIEDKLPYIIKEGDIISAAAIRIDESIAEQIENFLFRSNANSSSRVEETTVCTSTAK